VIGSATVLGVITARGGSKGLPRKNVLDLGGKPLIAWTIEAARAAETIDRVVVSSDDAEIIAVAQAWGADAPFVRPAELARDDTPGVEPVLHALEAVGQPYDYVVLLQPTSPFRTSQDIDAAVSMCVATGAPAVVGVAAAKASLYWTFTVAADGLMQPVLPAQGVIGRRQEIPPTYTLNGAMYVARTDWLRSSGTFFGEATVAFVMSAEHSIDIDSPLDLRIARALVARPGDGGTAAE
jgi:N-acylneuraminate cytidylyltransferase